MASVIKRGKRRWYGRIKIGEHWRIVRLPAVFSGEGAISKDRAIALAVEAELIANKSTHNSITENEVNQFLGKLVALTVNGQVDKAISTSDFIKEWLDVIKKNSKESTFITQEQILKSFLDYLGENKAKSLNKTLDSDTAKKYLAHLDGKGYAKSTIGQYVKSLAALSNYAMKSRKLANNSFTGLVIGGKVTKKREGFTLELATKLLDASDGDFRTVISILLYTGMRVGDALKLDWNNINMSEETMTFTPEKQRKGKEQPLTIPICPKLSQVFRSLPKDRELIGARFRRFQIVYHAIKDKLEEIGVKQTKGLSAHSCRHFFISMLADAGVREEVRMRLVGHASGDSKVHALYTHLSMSTLKEEINKVQWLGKICVHRKNRDFYLECSNAATTNSTHHYNEEQRRNHQHPHRRS